MRIIIELDGISHEAVDVRSTEARSMSSEPPPELLAAARALGAESAGIAAFSLPAGSLAVLASDDLTKRATLSDLDAGKPVDEAAASKQPAKKPRAKTGKR